jgi:hypothetical protein
MSNEPERARRRAARNAVEKAKRNRDAARKKLLAQRRKLERMRDQNRDRTERNRAENEGSGNPTTHSTVPRSDRTDEAATGSSSTVPERPRHSTVTPRRRLYGLKLHRAAREDEDG